MKRTALLLATTAAVLAAPAHAREGQFYIGLEGGVTEGDQVDIDLAVTDPQTNAAFAEPNTGLDADIVFGYDFGSFRLEAEGAYKNRGIDDVTLLNPTFTAGGATTPQSFVSSSGGLDIISGMVNALVEHGDDDGIQIYAGGGIGIASVDLSITPAQFGDLIDDTGSDLAYQAIAGVRFPVSDRIDLGVKYRYFVVDEFELDAGNGNPIEVDYQSHSVLASVIFNLGGKAPPPPPKTTPVYQKWAFQIACSESFT